MKKWIFFFLFIAKSAFANVAVTENEPGSLVQGIVSAVTGDLYAFEEDIVIEGTEPIRLKRSYVSAKGRGRFILFENLLANRLGDQINHITVPESNGTFLTYIYKDDGKERNRVFLFYPLHSDAMGLTNTARGSLSAQTNLKNQYVELSKKKDKFTVFAPNGAKRIYEITGYKEDLSPLVKYSYLLTLEEMPNGNKIIYTWDEKKELLLSIHTTDPSEEKIYAKATFKHYRKQKKDKEGRYYISSPHMDIHTSDGRTLSYRYSREGQKHENHWLLTRIISPDLPEEGVGYREGLVTGFGYANQLMLSIEYDSKKRVQALSTPVGTIQQLSYLPEERKTIALDADGIPTHYFWDEDLKLTSIKRFSNPENPHSHILFIWGKDRDSSNLICKVLFDQNERPLHATRYIYDEKGNVLQEKFYGNLSGAGSVLVLDWENLPLDTGEVYTKSFTYTQDDRNLLLKKEEDNGLCALYDYLPETNLRTLEAIYEKGQLKKRMLYEYNSDRILIRETIESGSLRLIKEIIPKSGQPYLGMPFILLEKYGEKLLKKTVLHYGIGGRISQKDIYDAEENFRYSLTYTYDAKGRLIQETNALGQISKNSYDNLGNKTFFQDFGKSASTQMTYDNANRPIKSEETGDGISHMTQYSYDKKHNRIETVDLHGYKTKFTYDAFGQLIQTLSPNGALTASAYDTLGNEFSHTDPNGHTTFTTYSAYGKPIHIQYPDGTEEAFLYNRDGTLKLHIDQIGTETAYTYDIFGHTTSKTISSNGSGIFKETWSYDAFNLLSHTDAEGTVTTYTYDEAGRKITEACGEEKIAYAYDELGRLHITQEGELLSITSYDLLDRPVEERKEDLSGNLLARKLYAYDSAGNRSEIARFIEGKEAKDFFEYDAFGRLIKKTDPLGYSEIYLYDDKNHKKITIDPLGLQTIESYSAHYLLSSLEKRNPQKNFLREENFYDLGDNLIRKVSYLPGRSITTRWEYDCMGRLSTLIEADQKITRYTYTPTGHLLQTLKPSGITLINSYGPLGYLLSQTSSDGTVRYTHLRDRLGRLLQSTDLTTGATLYRTYDPKGCLLTEILPSGLHFAHHYDKRGRRTRLELPDGSTVDYVYGALHLRSVIRNSYAHQFTSYDLSGNLLSEQFIDNLGNATHSYDLAGRHTTYNSPYFSHKILEIDPLGNILKSDLSGEILDYTYDELYQLASEKDHTYAHDPHYNRLKKDGVALGINSLNQLSSFTYDLDGNPLSDGQSHFTYDALGRLIAYENGTNHVSFAYDALHRRISKTHLSPGPSKTLFFLYDDQNEIGLTDAEGPIQELRILSNTPNAEIGSAIAFELEGKVFAPLHDLYGNVADIVSSGAQEEYRYTAFGEPLLNNSLSPWRFSSKRLDPESGLIYFGRRYYMPSQGRWLTPDPLGLDAGPNLYAFVSNCPLTHVDLYGLMGFYGLGLREEFNEFNKKIGERFASANRQDYKQIGIGALHGVGDFAMGAFTAASYAGYGLSLPFQSIGWLSGSGSLSQSWSSFRSSNEAFFHKGSSLMHRILPGDTSSDFYRGARWGSEISLEVATAITGIGALRRGISLATQGIRVSQNVLKESFLINKSIEANQIWTATKKRTPVQNAFRHWKDHGSEFPELLNSKQYVEKTHNFFVSRDKLLTKIRPNGEIIVYDTEANVFGAFTNEGIPKTMFKPADGILYWERN